MRVLAATTAGGGHFGPMVPVLSAVARAGHEVRVACPESFVGEVEAAGLDAAPFDDAPPEEMHAVFARLPGLSHEESNAVVVREAFGRLDTAAALPGLSATVAAWRPDVVVRDPAEFASWVVAEHEAIPHVRVAIGLLSSEAQIARVAAPAVEGGADLDGGAGRRLADGPVVAAAPASFDPPDGLALGQVHRYRPPPAPAGPVPAPVPRGDDPLVYVTLGTVAASLGLWPGVYRLVVDALGDLPVRVLVTTGRGVDTTAIGPLPPRVAVVDYVAQDEVLPHAALLVTHGGFGTVLGGLRHGVPMVVTPLFADQPDNAARVAETGAGVRVQLSTEPMDVRPELGAAVHSAVAALLLDDEARDVARHMAEDMAAQPPLETVVDHLEASAAGRGPVPGDPIPGSHRKGR